MKSESGHNKFYIHHKHILNMQAQGSTITQNNITEAIHPETKIYYVSLHTGFGSYLSPNLYSDYYFKIDHK